MTYEKSITLHQQDGGMSIQAFADREGLTLKQARNCIRRGKVLGARQDARSKHWWIYPPAKLMERPRGCTKPSAAGAANTSDLAANTSDQSVYQSDGHPAEKPVLMVLDAVLPVAAHTATPGAPASCGKAFKFNAFDGEPQNVYTCPETQAVLRELREAAAKRLREGISYLRLEGREFAQLYAALDRERGRIRKLVGKGLVDIGNLRASDSIWQKLQAVSQQGRLL
ncbi:MAG: hypothetical protein Q8O64_11290 [Sideroxyarcus sp.]|nr:hypothetical protein [Sideroxyarcus sp.]